MVHGIMTMTVTVAMMRTDLHFFPCSDSNSARIGKGTISAGLTRAATPQIAPQVAQPLDSPIRNRSVSNIASANTSADKDVSQGINGIIAMGGDSAHIHPENTPALSL